MLSVILIWAYILISTYGMGIVLLGLAKKVLGYETDSILAILLTGLVGVTAYAQFASLVGGVGLVANLILCVLVAIGLFAMRKEVKSPLASIQIIRTTGIVAAIIFLVMAYGTSHGIMHYDTALYHAQSIHWIEEYGIVPGLGNLHCRLGYNSAAFPLNALYSFAFLGGQSYHVTAGYCALLLAWECMGVARNIQNKQITVSLFARFMAVYYLLIIYDEMVSPASDYYMVTLAFIFFISLLDMCETTVSVEGLAMLAFLGALILTIKLSGGLLILCAIIPGFAFARQKRIRELVGSLITGIVIVIPYLIRNVIISGWLLYPSTGIDLFEVDWKIPETTAAYDYKEIQVYGRGFTDVSRYEEPITSWFREWFSSQSALDRLFICLAIVGVVYFVVKCLYYGFSLCFCKKKHRVGLELFVEALIVLCFLFWLFTSPLMRYGCLYVYLVDAIIWGGLVAKLAHKKAVSRTVVIVLGLVLCYKALMFGREVVTGFRGDCFVKQQDYINYEVTQYNIGSLTVYMPVEGDQTGYDAFPSSPWQMDICMRGDSIEDGFRVNNQ